MNKYLGESFLSRLYRDMHISKQVEKSSNISDNKYEKIRKYLQRLESIHYNVKDKNKIKLLKEFYYDKYVIKKENIDDDYFKYLEENALNRGFGHIKYNKFILDREKDVIINDQKKSLDLWINYFISEDSKMYPTWFKYYVFQSVVKLGSYNKENNIYNQRNDFTISVFPELNREAISIMYDYFIEFLNGKKDLEDKELLKLINSGSFKKIYAYLIKKLSLMGKEMASSNDGKWIKYEQGTDHMKLVKSLEGKGTGWCTVGEATAKEQLDGGDFYVYYSYDFEGNPTIPRIAIRMEEDNIAEIRGIEKNQNIEVEMEDILEEKLNEFPDKYEYKKKVHDMGLLTKIYNKNKKDIELTKEDLRFLYEIDGKIESFGYEIDPRINEILSLRNKKNDLCFIFGCKENEIILNGECKYNVSDLLNGKIKYFEDYLTITIKNAKYIVLPIYVGGFLDLDNLINVESLVLPNTINGDLYLNRLTNANGLVIPKNVDNVYLRGLNTIDGLELPDDFNINKLVLKEELKWELINQKKKKNKIKTAC